MKASFRNGLVLIGVSSLILSASLCSAAKDTGTLETQLSSKPLLWVVETNEDDARMSLDRISGDHDSPYLTGDSSYSSENHHLAGPFALSKLNESRD